MDRLEAQTATPVTSARRKIRRAISRDQQTYIRGMAARLPKVPGAAGARPDPNHVEMRSAILPVYPVPLNISRKDKLSDRDRDIKDLVARRLKPLLVLSVLAQHPVKNLPKG
jgi:hypothetical protein